MELFRMSCPPLTAVAGRGIVTSCGADRPDYLLNAYVQFRLIRELGCDLPIECWYAGAAEKSERFAEFVEPFGVTCRDAVAAGYIGHPLVKAVRFRGNLYNQAQLHGYSLKPFAMLASGFAEFIWLDADCHPILSPAAGFDQPEYRATGALVWEDDPRATYHFPQLAPFGITVPSGQQNGWETGQMVIDKRRHWRALQLANWFCANAEYWFQFVFGDKDAFFAAWLKEGEPYWHGKPHVHNGRCFIHPLPDGRPFVLHRAGAHAKLRLGAVPADPLANFPHKPFAAHAVDEFVRWHAHKRQTRRPNDAIIRHAPNKIKPKKGTSRPRSQVMTATAQGRVLWVPEADEDVGLSIRREGVWEPQTTEYLQKVVQNGWNCVDVGANVGYFTMLIADLVGPSGRVVAVEPLAELCECIGKSAIANGFSERVAVIESAASERDGAILRLNMHSSKLGVTTERRPLDWTVAGTRDVESVTLDHVLEPWNRCDLIKVDVEGSEPGVIRGARSTIERHRPLILVEFLPRHCDSPLLWLEELGAIGEIRAVERGGLTRDVSAAELLAQSNRLWMLEVAPHSLEYHRTLAR